RPGGKIGLLARILRGEIRWADLNPVRGREQAGLRPVLVLSHDVFNERSGTVIAVALTSQEPRASFPLTLESNAPRLPKRSWVRIRQVRTLSVDRIGRRLARASEEEVDRVVEGLNWLRFILCADRRRLAGVDRPLLRGDATAAVSDAQRNSETDSAARVATV